QLLEYYSKRRKRTMVEQHRALMESLRIRHENEAAELRRRYAALERLEHREFTTFGQKFGEVFREDDNRSVRFHLGPYMASLELDLRDNAVSESDLIVTFR